MNVLSFIERHQSDVKEKILRHCGLWKEFPPRAPPVEFTVADRPPGIAAGKVQYSSEQLICR
jgi:hypothetical protein